MLEKQPIPPGVPKPVSSWPFLVVLIPLVAGLTVLVMDRARGPEVRDRAVEVVQVDEQVAQNVAEPAIAAEPTPAEPVVAERVVVEPVVAEPVVAEPISAIPQDTIAEPVTAPEASPAEPAIADSPPTTESAAPEPMNGTLSIPDSTLFAVPDFQPSDALLTAIQAQDWEIYLRQYDAELVAAMERQDARARDTCAKSGQIARYLLITNQPSLNAAAICDELNSDDFRTQLAVRYRNGRDVEAMRFLSVAPWRPTSYAALGQMDADPAVARAVFDDIVQQVDAGAISHANAVALLRLYAVRAGVDAAQFRRDVEMAADEPIVDTPTTVVLRVQLSIRLSY